MGYDHFRYARKIDADNIGIYHSDMTELMRLDKGTANKIRWEGGLGTSKALQIAANTVNPFPIIELETTGRININPASAQDVWLTTGGAGRLRYGTQSAIVAETLTDYLPAKDAAGAAIKIALVS